MTIINPNSIAGITSLTAEADVMNFYKSDGTFGSLQLNGCNFNTTNGISTFNNLVVGGTLTYEDVKNVDSVGIITARGGLNVTANTDTDTLNVSGISTFGGVVKIPTVAGTNTNAALGVLFQTAAGVIDGGSGLTYNPSQDTFSVNGNHISINTFRGNGDLGTLTCSNHSSTTFVSVSSKVDIGLKDNTAGAFNIKEGSNEYITVDTTNSSELIKFGTAGTERLRITSAGLISIGDENNLDSQLTITQAQGDCIRLRTSASNNTFKYGIVKQEPYNNNAAGIQIIGAKSDSGYTEVDIGGGIDGGYAATQLDFWTAANTTTATGTRRVRIDSAGRVLIGTTTVGSATADDLTVATSGDTGITIRSGTSNSGNLFFSDGTSGNSNFRGYVQYLHSSNALLFGTNAGERLRITSSGKVGIGTDAPATRDTSGSLDIVADLNNNGPYFRVLNKHSTYGGGIQQMNNNARGGVQFLNASGTSVASLYNSTGGWTWDQNLQIHGGAGLRIGPSITSGYGNADLFVDTDTTTNGDHIAQFKGRTSGSNGAGLGFVHLTCGSDDDRTGIQWEHQNVSNERMWMGDDLRLYLKNGNPTESTAQGRYLMTVEGGSADFPDGTSYDNAAKSAVEIKKNYPASQSGNYWIFDHNNVPRQIYCDMEIDGGGWMLWNDYNTSSTSMNEALGGSSTSPNSGLARGNWGNYAYYQVLIRASDIDSTGERLHSIVQLDQNGALKYCADYGCDFFLEDVGDQFQPNISSYFNSGSTSEYIQMDRAYQPQLGASAWQTFSGGGWQSVYIREMDSRMSPGMHRSCHLVERIYGFDDNGVPRWEQADSMSCLPYWTDISLGGEVADGTNDFMMEHGRKIVANNGNSGAFAQGRMHGVLTGQFEVEVKLGYSWGWSQAIATSTMQIAENLRDASGAPYNIGLNHYYYAGIYNNSSNNKWMPVVNSPYGSYTEYQRSGGAGTSISNYIWRTSDGTILCRRSDNTHGTINLGVPYAGPLIITSGRQSPMMTEIVGVWDAKRGDQTGNRDRWYK